MRNLWFHQGSLLVDLVPWLNQPNMGKTVVAALTRYYCIEFGCSMVLRVSDYVSVGSWSVLWSDVVFCIGCALVWHGIQETVACVALFLTSTLHPAGFPFKKCSLFVNMYSIPLLIENPGICAVLPCSAQARYRAIQILLQRTQFAS